MNKEVAKKLDETAKKVAEGFSNPERAFNTNKETFVVDKITLLSESTAVVAFQKDDKKFALAFFYWLRCNGGEWRYFFPTDSHLLGMTLISQAKQCIEFANYGFNFN